MYQLKYSFDDSQSSFSLFSQREEIFEVPSTSDECTDRLVLDFDVSTKQALIIVDPKLAAKLKSHQRKGIQFLWDACYESLEEIKRGRRGGGAILAHCMGLGKTLQVTLSFQLRKTIRISFKYSEFHYITTNSFRIQIVAFVHTLFRYKETNVKTILILSPMTTLLNWKAEFEKWLKDVNDWDDANIHVLLAK